jgi:amino acid adenylation domain-containing protein
MPDPAWNRTERTYPEVLIHEAFADQAAREPAAPALRFRDEALTYQAFDERVGVLAAHLVDLGVAPGTLVAVCMERSVEMVVALHAILRSGCAYVPIDPEYPDERIAMMLDDLDQPILLTQRRLLGRFPAAIATVVPVDPPSGPASPAAFEAPTVSPDGVAYAIFTSGSTGRPKGALITHGAIANRIHWMQEYFGLTPADKVLQKTPFGFDVSVWEFFWPFLCGAQLVVAEPGGHRDSAYLTQTIIEQGITTIHFVPSMLELFLEDPRASDCVSLKHVICSGEALPKALQDRFFARLPAVGLHNLYGPTEAAVDVSAWACDPESPLPFVPIGKPIANTQLHILDAAMGPVPVGDVGELHIGGVQVGLGYLKRAELTAERFVTDPFRPGGTLYKTGDLARHLPDGTIEYLGRSDFQVKIRGFRVELGEIEAAMEAFDGVRRAVVVAHQRPGAGAELIAYLARQAGQELSIEELRSRLGERLPEYMVPSTFITVEQFPLNSSGKVDRKALPQPVRVRPDLGTPYVAGRTALERAIAQLWCGVLDLDRVGIHDRFFELGGTSLQAARFVNLLQAKFGEVILVATLFGAPSISQYAALLEEQYPAGVAQLLGLPPGERIIDIRAGSPGDRPAVPPANGSAAEPAAGPGAARRGRASLAEQRSRRQTARPSEHG